jgi:hypothetical protein
MFLITYIKSAITFLMPFLKPYLMTTADILLESAKEAVLTVADTLKDKNGATKRAEAFKLIKEKMIEKGKKVSSSLISKAIETSLTKVKQKLSDKLAPQAIGMTDVAGFTNASPEEKLSQAALYVKNKALEKGIKIPTSTVNLSVENALQSAKKHKKQG